MKPSRGVGGLRLLASPAALLVTLVWCTTLTLASIRPTRTVKRMIEVEPQHLVEDQCASFNTDLGKELKELLHLSWMEDAHDVDVCLCTSTLSNYVSHSRNRQIEIARAMVGKERVQEALKTLISKNHPKTCSPLPAHATRTCDDGGRHSSPCDISCKSPYRKASNGHTCVLPASPSARPRKRSLEDQVRFASASCKPNERLCARNSNGGLAKGHMSSFECLDVSSDLFNCGGCAAAALGITGEILGVDCSDLDGVFDVKCITGRCNVSRCQHGWTVNPIGDGCIKA